jgi:hypothetical protein
MARQVFFSFHYKPDNWRASQVRNIGVIEGNKPATDNEWEKIADGGDSAIKKWIDDNMNYRSCVIVLAGEKTAGRKWINYEIKKAWEDGKGVFGIFIHNLKDSSGEQTNQGENPFKYVTTDGSKLSSIVKCYNPPFSTSTYVYEYIEEHIAGWIEEAINIRDEN